MKKYFAIAATSTLLASSLSAFAAKPTSITFDSDGTTPDGKSYANYIVKCSNGQKQPLTAWNKRKKWCVGSESLENCHKKQIKAGQNRCSVSGVAFHPAGGEIAIASSDGTVRVWDLKLETICR